MLKHRLAHWCILMWRESMFCYILSWYFALTKIFLEIVCKSLICFKICCFYFKSHKRHWYKLFPRFLNFLIMPHFCISWFVVKWKLFLFFNYDVDGCWHVAYRTWNKLILILLWNGKNMVSVNVLWLQSYRNKSEVTTFAYFHDQEHISSGFLAEFCRQQMVCS